MSLTTVEDLRITLDQESLLHRIISRIRRSLELQEILSATAVEVRAFLGSERVKIYQFHADASGQVIAESIHENRLPSLLGLNFPADDIPPHARELFVKARVRSIVDVDSRQIGQSPVNDSQIGESLHEDICYRPLDPCHAEYLTAMGVKSSLVVPILHQDQLWGLLVSHHSEPGTIPEHQLQGIQMVVDQLSVAIAQSILLTQAREKAQREATINCIATLLHSLRTIELQQALEETVAAFQGVGGRLWIRPEAFGFQNGTCSYLTDCPNASSCAVKLYTCGTQPQLSELARYQLIEQYSVWQEHFESSHSQVWAIPDIYQVPSLRNLQPFFRPTKIRSLLMVPLQYRQQAIGYLCIFRDEIETETLWAGQFDPDQRQLYPRLSFEVWRESRKGQGQEWTADEIQMAQALGSQFATAIQQYETHQQLQSLNTNLENQVRERTAELQQAAEQQHALFSVVTKIRESLNVETIFQTTTKEVCQLLQVDRVAVYRFNSDWGGEFVEDFEFANPGKGKLVKLGTKTVWNDTYLQQTQGGRYRNNETYAVDDIYQMGHSPCHISILEQFGIKAYVLAPIFIGQTLWGLLAAYQHSRTRHWETAEIQFMTQVATQLGVALQQADLLTQTRQQAEQLTQAFQELQQTQTQLIQTEKMSSLGQLVAGIAHEINNPVNFIYANFNHVNEYCEELLNLVNLYQRYYPNPNSELIEQLEAIDLEFLVEDLPKTLASMKIGADRIRQIVLSLKNFSRLNEAEKKPVDIHEGIDSTLLILQHRLKAKPESPAIQLTKEYGNLPLVECYAGQLNQVFMNVLCNAIDALEQHRQFIPESHASQITIRTAVSELPDKIPSVVVRISDNGPGMPEDVVSRIFDPFFTTKPVGKGTGLGLSISHQIVVDKHGGVFKCNSHPEAGTEFWIEIPIRQLSEKQESP